MDDKLVELFVDIVILTTAQLGARRDADGFTQATVEAAIQDRFDEIAYIYETHPRFNQKRYTVYMISSMNEVEDEQLWPLFSRYCSFLKAIQTSKEFPVLLSRFRSLGWTEWINLALSRKAFENYAYETIQVAEELFEEHGALEVEWAEEIQDVSQAFEIPLSLKLGKYIQFLLCDTPEDLELEQCEEPESSPVWLQ